MILQRTLLILIILFVGTTAYAEEMKVSKIILGRFKSDLSEMVISPKAPPYWPRIDRHNLTVDDGGQVYVLNLSSRHIMGFDKEGRIIKKIPLPIAPIKKKLDRYGDLEVSGDGKRFFVNIPSQGSSYESTFIKGQGMTLNDKGEIIKGEGFPEVDIRLCDGTYVFLQGSYIYDKDFNLKKAKFTGFFDVEGQYKIDTKKRTLTKVDRDRKEIWSKQFDSNFGIVGIDTANYMYIHGMLKKGDPDSLYKLNSKGEIVAQAPVPKPFTFKTQAEKDEWEMHASEEFLSFFKVACNGDVYLIYQLSELPKATFKRWLKSGEYFIYKFETAK